MWAKSVVTCGLHEGVKAGEVVELLQSKGYNSTRVCQLSDDLWVLVPSSKVEKNMILNEDPEWLKLVFKFIRPWRESDLNGKRRVWIEVYGVPLHAWCPQFFTRIGNRLGKTVEVDELTMSKEDLRKGRILVSTPCLQKICRIFHFQI